MKSITSQGRECSEDGVELTSEDLTGVKFTFTDRPTEVLGTVRDSAGADHPLAPETSVYLFPVDRRYWTIYNPVSLRFREVRPTSRGTFEMKGLPEGNYFLVATTLFTSGKTWRMPEFLERLVPLATRISLGEGEARVETLDLRKSK